jgi:class 3 adenylate cyclase/tetratricopeptide (TPR) repeat protein
VTETATVTLLFTDLAQSTELLARLGDDAAEDLRRTHFALLREAAVVSRGQEVKTLGDGLMVAFPSALAGVSCAVAMQQRVEHHNAAHPEQQLRLRIGINVGEAVSEEDDYFGTPVVIAKRLCDRADPGQILVSHVVQALVGSRGGFRFRDRGSLSLKGLADPVPAAELEWRQNGSAESAVAEAQRADTDHGPAAAADVPAGLSREASGRFVGRERDLARLAEHLQRARAGHRTLALLAGEPGVGKTRLAAEFAQRAHGEGVRVLYGRCEEEALVPFQPFVEALDHYIESCRADELRSQLGDAGDELTRLLPGLRRRLPDLSQPAGGDPATERYRLFEAVVGFLSRMASVAPVVLVVDDLHWADKSTLLLLTHVMQAPAQAELLILGTYRDVELTPSHPLTDTLAALRRDRLVERLGLEGLSEEEVGALIAAWGRQVPPAQLVRAIWSNTEGHPFFVQELLRHLVEMGAIYERGGRLKSNIERIGIPEGIRDVIQSRLGRLDEATRRVLSVGAVIGREFSVDLLERVSAVSGERLFELLEQAAAARVIGETPGLGGYAFSHALIRDTLYRDLTTPHRVRLHQQIGQALEELASADDGATLSELAHHYFEAAAGSAALVKAIDYAIRAAQRAEKQLAYEEAASQYQRAVHALALKGVDEPRRCELMLALGECQWNAGEFTLARQTFRQTGELAERLGLADALARAALGFGGGFGFDVARIDPVLSSMLERALAQLPEQDDPLRARVLARLAEELAFSQRHRARVLIDEAIETARRLGDPAVLAEVLVRGQWARVGPEEADEQLATGREIQRLSREAGMLTTLFEGQSWEIGALLKLGDVEAARAVLEEHSLLAQRLRLPYFSWLAAVHETDRAHFERPASEIEALAWRTVELGQAAQNPTAFQVLGGVMLGVRWFQGRLTEMRAAAESFTECISAIPAWRCGLAWIYAELGHEEDARREFERVATNDFDDIPRDLFWLTAMAYLADACAYLGDEQRAAQLYRMLAPYEDLFIVLGEWVAPVGAVSVRLGTLAAAMGRFDQALQHFDAALERERRSGPPYALADTALRCASTLLERAQPGDRERAVALIDEAVVMGERFEMTSLVEKASVLRAEATGASPERLVARGRLRLGERAARMRSEARAAVSTRGRATLARLFGDDSDEELERRFGSALAQRALLTGMARSFQPRLALGFQGEIQYELIHVGGADAARASDWWTIRVDGSKAVARHRTAHDPAVTVHVSVPEFVRLFSGEDDPVAAILDGRLTAEGDLLLGARLTEMFGAVSPSDVLPAGA